MLSPNERVLDVGAGDCYLDVELARRARCATTQIDVSDTNRTSLPVDIYDGRELPYPAVGSDTGLLLFVLPYADAPGALPKEAKRV